jgi:large subunit ribosomal protein L19e
MSLHRKKVLAARVLDIGVSRVRFDPERLTEIQDAITRDSIRALVNDGAVWVAPARGVSRGRVRARRARRVRRGRGAGSKKGGQGARSGRKQAWVTRVRALRRYLRVLRDRGDITGETFRQVYAQVKGGQIRSVRHLRELARQHTRR